MTLYEKIKNMDIEQMACLLSRITIDSLYNAAEALGENPGVTTLEDTKAIVDTWKEVLLEENE